jgi:hypothetical protein
MSSRVQILFGIVVALCIAQLVGPLVLSYSIEDDAIAIRLAHFLRLYRIKYSDITRVCHRSDGAVFAVIRYASIINRPFFPGGCVIIHRGERLPLVITPRRPQEFIAAVERQVSTRHPGR